VNIAEATADNLTVEAENADITKSNTTGDTKITTRGDTKIAEATADNLTIEAENTDITKSSTTGDTNVTTRGDTKIAEATVGGNFSNTSGNTVVIGKLDVADNTKITANNDVSIADLNTDTLTLKTQSENVNITGDIKTKGTIDTASKNIVVDNTSLEAYPYATTQLYLTKKPMHLIVDKSNNIRTESQNVTRHSINTLVNKEAYATSMEGEITLASETALRNSYHGETVMDEADDSLYNSSTVSDYISSAVGSRDHLIADDKGTLINHINVMDIIRQGTPHRSVNQNFSQDDERKKKGKGNLKKAENTILKNIDVAAILGK
jgi:hypothetical protein